MGRPRGSEPAGRRRLEADLHAGYPDAIGVDDLAIHHVRVVRVGIRGDLDLGARRDRGARRCPFERSLLEGLRARSSSSSRLVLSCSIRPTRVSPQPKTDSGESEQNRQTEDERTGLPVHGLPWARARSSVFCLARQRRERGESRTRRTAAAPVRLAQRRNRQSSCWIRRSPRDDRGAARPGVSDDTSGNPFPRSEGPPTGRNEVHVVRRLARSILSLAMRPNPQPVADPVSRNPIRSGPGIAALRRVGRERARSENFELNSIETAQLHVTD